MSSRLMLVLAGAMASGITLLVVRIVASVIEQVVKGGLQ